MRFYFKLNGVFTLNEVHRHICSCFKHKLTSFGIILKILLLNLKSLFQQTRQKYIIGVWLIWKALIWSIWFYKQFVSYYILLMLSLQGACVRDTS